MSNTEAKVMALPKCDFCSERAKYDGKTKNGQWANMCQKDFDEYGVGLGMGRGQKLVVQQPAKPDGRKGVLIAKLISDLADVVEDGAADVECPQCGEIKTVEPDACYTYSCEGCGASVRVDVEGEML